MALVAQELVHTPDYADLALWECTRDPVLFQMYWLPDPNSKRSLAQYKWDPQESRKVWYLQYPMLLQPMFLAECGRAIGKTTVGMIGATAYDMVNFNNEKCAVIGPSEQHTMRVFDSVVNFIQDHRYLQFWLQKDNRQTGIRTAKRQIRTRNGWELHGLIPGRKGIGIKGEHPNRARGDEAQDIPEDAWVMMADMIRPFDPVNLQSLEHYFGVPDGNRTSVYAKMCYDKNGRWAGWKKRIPSYLSPLMTRESFLKTLKDSNCQFVETADGRIIVTEYSNWGKRNILGQWGDPESPCFPLRVYEACTREEGIPDYKVLVINPLLVSQSGMAAEDLMTQLLLTGPQRDRYLPEPPQVVWVCVDPGPAFCSVTVWGKFKKPLPGHTADWWLLERIELTDIMETTLLTTLVDRIANFWRAEWIGSDSTSQSVYVADWLLNEQMFAHMQRFRLAHKTLQVSTNAWEPETIALAKGWKGQVVVPCYFNGNLPMGYINTTDDKGRPLQNPDMKDADIATVRILQNVIVETNPRLLLPNQQQDLAFFAEVTSYREVLTGGKRFEPAHPHMVSTMKVFAMMLHYAELLDIPAKPSGRPAYAGSMPMGTRL